MQEASISCSEHDAPHKLLLALQQLIIAVATADPWEFDRKRYDELIGIWEALDAERDANT